MSMLTPSTLYTANLVFKLPGARGFLTQAVNAEVGLAGGEKFKRTVILDPERGQRKNRARDKDHNNLPKKRGDGWMETELGKFFYDGGQEGELEMSVMDLTSHWNRGLTVLGIEIRPRES